MRIPLQPLLINSDFRRSELRFNDGIKRAELPNLAGYAIDPDHPVPPLVVCAFEASQEDGLPFFIPHYGSEKIKLVRIIFVEFEQPGDGSVPGYLQHREGRCLGGKILSDRADYTFVAFPYHGEQITFLRQNQVFAVENRHMDLRFHRHKDDFRIFREVSGVDKTGGVR